MKYLIINGSSHKGNTWNLAELSKNFISGYENNSQFKEIHLLDVKLPFCLGCSKCFRVGYIQCPHYEIVHNIIAAIEEADGIIISSTTCNMKETALLRNLFDHLCFMLHRPHFFKSKALVITTTGGIGAKTAAKSIADTLKGIGFNRCYLFPKTTFSWNDYIPSAKTKAALNNITKKFYNDVKSGKLHSPSLMLLIPYNLFRGMSLSYVAGSKYPTKDGEHWTNNERRKSVYDPAVFVPYHKRIAGHLFYKIGKFAGKQKSFQVSYKK